jgi:hypothetical protein
MSYQLIQKHPSFDFSNTWATQPTVGGSTANSRFSDPVPIAKLIFSIELSFLEKEAPQVLVLDYFLNSTAFYLYSYQRPFQN